MLIAYFAFLAVVSSVSAAPGRYKRFDDYFPPSYPFGAYSAVGFPFFQPYPWYGSPFGYFPIPDYSTMFLPWYKGPNVCETKKVMDEPDEMKEWMSEGFPDSGSFSHESESCRGNNEKYVCMKRVNKNGESKMEMRKLECCFGFVRPSDGSPGCVESSDEQTPSNKPTTATPSSSVVKMNDRLSYSYYKSSSPRAKSGVETVPIQ